MLQATNTETQYRTLCLLVNIYTDTSLEELVNTDTSLELVNTDTLLETTGPRFYWSILTRHWKQQYNRTPFLLVNTDTSLETAVQLDRTLFLLVNTDTSLD